MLPLLERVVGHLERVQRVTSKDVVERGVALDHDRFEAFALGLLDRMEASPPEHRWPWEREYLRAFVEDMYWRLLDGVCSQWTADERFGLIEASIAHVSDDEALARLPQVHRRLLPPLLAQTREELGFSRRWWHGRGPWFVAPDYCTHLGLTGPASPHARASPAGSLLVKLRGLDRLRWLLAIETSLATSSRDSWCIDLDSVRWLSEKRSWTIDSNTPEGPFPSDSTIRRWTELGTIGFAPHDPPHESLHLYELTTVGRTIFDELAKDSTTSFRIMVRALLEDEREQAMVPGGTKTPSPDRASTATLRHARMVAHEFRNALLPVQHALKKIWASPASAGDELTEYRRRVDEGLDRLHRFIDDSVRLTPIEAEEATSFTVMEVIDEARRQCVPGPPGGIAIETIPANANPRCRGHRGRLTLAFLNLLRNAVQVGGAETRVAITIDASTPGHTTIRVGDDGPGIPEERRETLFQNGISHRDGGSGHGLALVRRIVETEMGGRIRLAASENPTGATFELELPTEEES